MALRHPTDPFGDGSLLQSWTFTNTDGSATLDSQQSGNTFTPSTTADINTTSLSPTGYNSFKGDDNVTTNPITLNGSVDATVMGWIYMGRAFGSWNRIDFGEFGQRYNVSLILTDQGYSSQAVYARFQTHKEAQDLSISLGASTGWHHLACICDATAETVTCVLDGVVRGTLPQAMNWNDSKGIGIDNGASTSTRGITDIQYYNRKLTTTEINQIKTDNFPTPVTVLADSSLANFSNVTPYINPPTVIMEGIVASLGISSLNAFVADPPYTALSPFGDDSQIERWAFATGDMDTLQSNGNVFDDNGLVAPNAYASSGSLGFNHTNTGQYEGGRDDTLVLTQTLNGVSLSGNVDMTLFCNVLADTSVSSFEFNYTTYQGSVEVGYGELNTANNIQVYAHRSSGHVNTLVISLDNGAVSYTHPSPSNNSFVTITYNSTTNDINIYISGIHATTLNHAMSFVNTNLIEVEGTYNSKLSNLHYYNRLILPIEIEKLALNYFTTGSSTLAYSRADCTFLDPFDDGSLIHSWGFEDSLTDDQGLITLEHSCRHAYSELPASNKIGIFSSSGNLLTHNNYPAITSDFSISFVFGISEQFTFEFGDRFGTYHSKIDFFYDTNAQTFRVQHFITQGFGYDVLFQGAISSDTLNHSVCFTSSSTEGTKCYVNGFLVGSGVNLFDISSSTEKQCRVNLVGRFFVDELLIFNRELTEGESVWVTNGLIGKAIVENEPIQVQTSMLSEFYMMEFAVQAVSPYPIVLNTKALAIFSPIDLVGNIQEEYKFRDISTGNLTSNNVAEDNNIILETDALLLEDSLYSNSGSISNLPNTGAFSTSNNPQKLSGTTDCCIIFNVRESSDSIGYISLNYGSVNGVLKVSFNYGGVHIEYKGQLVSLWTSNMSDDWYSFALNLHNNDTLIEVYIGSVFRHSFVVSSPLEFDSTNGYIGIGGTSNDTSVQFSNITYLDKVLSEREIDFASSGYEARYVPIPSYIEIELPLKNANVNSTTIPMYVYPQEQTIITYPTIPFIAPLVQSVVNKPFICDNVVVLGSRLNINVTGNSHLVVTYPLESMDISFTVITPYFHDSVNTNINIDNIFMVLSLIDLVQPDILNFDSVVNSLGYVGEATQIGGGLYPENKVFAQSLYLNISSLLIFTKKDCYTHPHTLPIYINSIPINISTSTYPNIISLNLLPTKSVAQSNNDDKAVSKLGNFTFNSPIDWSENIEANLFLSGTDKAVDGNSIVSVLKKQTFTRECTIGLKSDIILTKDEVNSLKNLINLDTVRIEFVDGTWEDAKYDLLNTPLTIYPLYEGSIYSTVVIKVLI